MEIWTLLQRARGYACVGDADGADMAVGGEFEPVDANDAMVGFGVAERAAMVNDIINIGAGDMDH